MTQAEVFTMLEKMNIPVAYDHFQTTQKLPFMAFLYPESDNTFADGKVYYKSKILHIELYTEKKDTALEKKLETILDDSGIAYQSSESWIDEDKMYEILYITEV